jgi:hypothetical protein
MPIKKGSAEATVSRHIRGSIEDISKIKIFKFECKDTKKKTPRHQVFLSIILKLGVLKSWSLGDF